MALFRLYLFEDGRPFIATGAPGGSRIITAVLQSILNVVDHHMDMKTAVSDPRFHSEEKQLLYLEPAFPESSAKALRKLGNIVERGTYMSCVQSILVHPETGELETDPDPRGGAGVGYYT